jgi:hypothetical protein
MRHILNNPAKYDALAFGSSRVNSIDASAINTMSCGNLAYSEGLPAEHLQDLETMVYNGIVPKLVLVGVDEISCFIDPELHKRQLMRMSPPRIILPDFVPLRVRRLITKTGYLTFLINYCDPNMILSSIKIIKAHKSAEESGYDWNNAQPYWESYNKNRIEACLSDIKKIVDLCRRNNIKLVVFTNPLHVLTYQKSADNGYLDFLYKLSEATAYYNFSGINAVTTNNDNYLETSHYKITIGNMIIDTLFNDKTDADLLSQGFGYYVTVHNRDQLLAILRNQRESFLGDK